MMLIDEIVEEGKRERRTCLDVKGEERETK
jgi:hypothetical protein